MFIFKIDVILCWDMSLVIQAAKGFDPIRSKTALEILLVDRTNEFRSLAETLFVISPAQRKPIKNWEVFVINFCFEVDEGFKCWSGNKELSTNSGLKALTILRQLSRNTTTMNQMTHLLNIAFNLAQEFKVIYKRIE